MIDYIINNSARDYFLKCFHANKFRCLYDIEMTNGDFVNGIPSDKKLKQIGREIGFLHKLTIKINQVYQI